MQFHHTQLANGLDIIAETNPRAYSLALGFVVRTGARDESDDVSGVSHFLEHMAFKGSDRFSSEQINRLFDDVGASHNAFTSQEITLYHAAIIPETLDSSFELLSSLLRPSLRQSDFDVEKEVILEEIAERDDSPAAIVFDKVMEQHFRGHPLGRSILGTTESIRDLTRDQMHNYFSRAYVAGNITLVVAGKCEFPRIVELAERHCGNWPRGNAQRDIFDARPARSVSKIERASSVQQHVVSLARGPSATNPLRYAAGLLAVAVGDNDNSRLYWELIDTGRADVAELGHNDFDGSGTWATYLCCEPDDLPANLESLGNIQRQVNREGITAEELAMAKNKVATAVVLSGERPMGRLSSLGGNWVYAREYRSIQDELQSVKAVSLDDIRQLLDEFPLTLTSTVGIGPLSKLPEIPVT